MDPSELAQEIAADTEGALQGMGPKAGQPEGPMETDSWGRTFDPNIHLSKGGQPSRHPRTGRLMCKPGKGLGSAPKVKAEAAPISSLPGFEDGAAGGDALELPGMEELAPPYDPMDAVDAAEAITDVTEMAGRGLAGDEGAPTPEEKERRFSRWKRLFERHQWSIPFILPIQCALSEGKYLTRCAMTEKGQERIERISYWAQGRPVPPKEIPSHVAEDRRRETHKDPADEGQQDAPPDLDSI